MITTFAVPTDDGRFRVGHLNSSYTTIRDHAPEGAVIIAPEVYERASPAELRRAVLGEPNPLRKLFQTVHVVSNPVDRAGEFMNEVGRKIATWVNAGKPTSESRGTFSPDEVRAITDAVRDLGGYLNKKSTKRALVAAKPERLAAFQNELVKLCRAFADLDGIRGVGGEMNDFVDGARGINDCLAETGASDTRIRVSSERVGIWEWAHLRFLGEASEIRRYDISAA